MKKALEPISSEQLRDLLSLVSIDVDEATIEAWTPQQREDAEAWAGACYLRASDNILRVPPKPTWLPAEGA